MKKIKALIVRSPGTNCDVETANSLKLVGAGVEAAHIDAILAGKVRIDDYSLHVFPGRFSSADYVAAGKICSVKLKKVI